MLYSKLESYKLIELGRNILWIKLKQEICWNLVAIAWSKAGEVIASGANSGNPDREKIMGELGFVGGAYEECDGYKLAFAFSGALSEEDLEVAQFGIEKFKEYANQ